MHSPCSPSWGTKIWLFGEYSEVYHNHFDIAFNTKGQLTIAPLENGFKFTKISHRAGIATGLYNIELNKHIQHIVLLHARSR